jgi:three-Cys-motif partner protein
MSKQSQREFYGTHTERKLVAVEQYLKSFLQVVSRQSFETIYVDAFAGSGTMPVGLGGELLAEIDDAKSFVEGSALRALRLPLKFSRYVFVDTSPRKLNELRTKLEASGASGANIQFVKDTADSAIASLCSELRRPNVRSVVFLDPFGSQVSWNTLNELAATRHVDLWYLFPAGLCVNRQISSDGRFTPEQKSSLDRLFGVEDWVERLVAREPIRDLFGESERTSKRVSIDDITRYMIERMDGIFAGGVQKSWLPLGRDGAHWYSLIFAMANPGAKASQIGHRIARNILTRN